MVRIVQFLDRTLYPAYDRNWDDRMFRETILKRLQSNFIVLDLGAGAGIVEDMNFRGLAAKVCGVDLDERVTANPMLDEGKVADGIAIPYPDAAFDLVFADNVLEHLDNPLSVFREVTRVLKPGGSFLFKTPNKHHYMPAIARLTPHGFHRYVNRKRGRSEIDTFPTRYKANSKKDINRLAHDSGLEIETLRLIEGRPEYLRLNGLTYLAGAAYERTVNASGLLAALRILLIGELRKPGPGGLSSAQPSCEFLHAAFD